MLMKENNFWMPVTFSDEKTAQRLQDALDALQEVHDWTMDYLKEYLVENLGVPPYKGFQEKLTILSRRKKLFRWTQQYSMRRTAEQTFSYFYTQYQMDEGKITLVKPRTVDRIQIQAREVWRKYLALYGLISTRYGPMYPNDLADGTSWRSVLREQAGSAEPDLIPFLWHSVTVKMTEDGWQMRFNLHRKKFRFGKEAVKKWKEAYDQ